MSEARAPIPTVVLIYGLLGLIPFLAPPVVSAVWPGLAAEAARVQSLYAAIILSFLGGARWGLAVTQARADPLKITLAMVPSLTAWAAVVGLAEAPRLELALLALALAAQWLWDLTGQGRPAWYGRLRTLLSGFAIIGLLGGVAIGVRSTTRTDAPPLVTAR